MRRPPRYALSPRETTSVPSCSQPSRVKRLRAGLMAALDRRCARRQHEVWSGRWNGPCSDRTKEWRSDCDWAAQLILFVRPKRSGSARSASRVPSPKPPDPPSASLSARIYSELQSLPAQRFIAAQIRISQVLCFITRTLVSPKRITIGRQA